jgi:hypothetical protein
MLKGEFLKFNSNSGYISGSDFMQALSHFSYNLSRFARAYWSSRHV